MGKKIAALLVLALLAGCLSMPSSFAYFDASGAPAKPKDVAECEYEAAKFSNAPGSPDARIEIRCMQLRGYHLERRRS